MTVYTAVLYAHLLGAFAFFIACGIEWTASALFRGATSTEQVGAWLRVFKVSPPLYGVGLLVLLLSGGYLASLSGTMKQGWIPATLLAMGVAIVLGVTLILPRMKKIRNALPSLNQEVSGEFRSLLSDPLLHSAIRTRVLLGVGIVYLMTAKIPFTASLLALAAAFALGVAVSIPAWRRSA
jgi:hypothetical protein